MRIERLQNLPAPSCCRVLLPTMPPQTPTPLNDKAIAAALRDRLHGLSPAQAGAMRKVMRLNAAGDKLMAAQWLLQLAREAPDHPEVLLWQGMRHAEAQDWPAAAANLARVAAARPAEPGPWCMLGNAQGRAGDGNAARASLRQALACARAAGDWLKISIECDAQGFYEEALQAVQSHLRLEPQSAVGLLQRARCLKALGEAEAAAADCRTLISRDQDAARAWFSLVDLKTVALTAAEVDALALAAERTGLAQFDRTLLDFALGKALEDAGRQAEALDAYQRANAAVRAGQPWDAAAFAQHVDAVRKAFTGGPPMETGMQAGVQAGVHADMQAGAQARVEKSTQGREVIFIVGLPRSGSTLVEQVLASHSQVEGASELPYLPLLIEAESRRRGKPFPVWVGSASADDWARLGREYLRMSAQWRADKPIATDKLPDNWLYVGAIRAMLPGAHIVDCRRDLLETCWSCYKQLFAPGLVGFSYDFESLALYSQLCESLGYFWAADHPRHVRVQRYESLVRDTEAQVRELLDFCGLPFEPACLASHTAQRAIRTPSALQVRQPMRQTSTPAARFGALLEPLYQALKKRNGAALS